ncbi:MAG TPA: cation diffusion facilitator family transporter [Gemmatimonadales bacterium]|nr:cation diffusion facilitator family transporter [Gemmatimonadales bacterium]
MRQSSRLGTVLVLTAAFMVVEVVGGLVSGSLALLADAGHMLTDVAALGLAVLSQRVAQRPADDRRTYGYLRLEILAALLNGAILFALSVWIVVEAVHRLGSPEPIKGTLFAAIAALGLVVNLVALRLLHGDANHDLNTRGAYLHIMGDLLGSVGALVAAGIVILTGWTLADPIVSVMLSLLILVSAWRLLRESVDVLLEAVPKHIRMDEVERRLRAVPGICDVHDLHVWTVTSGVIAMSGHVVVPELADHPRVLTASHEAMGSLGIGHATIQVEIAGECTPDHDGPLSTRRRGHEHAHGDHGHAHHH